MGYTENDYIELCKKQLEKKFSFGNGNGYSEKDLELLSNYIEEKKGVYISLSTLKRIWKNRLKQGPQLATLNALAAALDFENWQEFKLKNNREKPVVALQRERFSKRLKMGLALGALTAIAFIVLLLHKTSSNSGVSINGPIIFKANKTVTKGVPNTYIFNYDVSNVEADSFFIQQSWNSWRRKRLDPNNTVYSSIYFESGFHRAKLYANDEIIAKIPIHILSDGWEPHVYYDESDERFIDFHGENFINDGQLHIPVDLLVKRNVDTTHRYESQITNSQKFGVSSDDFSFVTRAKLDKTTNANCPRFVVIIVTEEHIFKVGLARNGCENYADYKLGEIYKDGANNDLSLFGQNVYEWQEVGINVKGKTAEIIINGKPTYSETFKEDFGDIMSILYLFEGTGSIDYVKLSDAEGEVAFEDDFSK